MKPNQSEEWQTATTKNFVKVCFKLIEMTGYYKIHKDENDFQECTIIGLKGLNKIQRELRISKG